MYIPKAFEVNDQEKIHSFIRKNSFGLLITHHNKSMEATHLPLLLEKQGDDFRLIGHVAKANPQWQHTNGEVLVVFQGPHTYISPTWYEEDHTVPTWNYVAVHVYGRMYIVDQQEEMKEIMSKSVEFYESGLKNPWNLDFDDDFLHQLMKGIVCFEIRIDRFEGKWKLNQNHSIEKQQRVIKALRESEKGDALKIADLMEKIARSKFDVII